ncbi:MAG: hypothetical protein ACOYN3_03805 [Acidimicrobiia bacterium]
MQSQFFRYGRGKSSEETLAVIDLSAEESLDATCGAIARLRSVASVLDELAERFADALGDREVRRDLGSGLIGGNAIERSLRWAAMEIEQARETLRLQSEEIPSGGLR